MDIHTMYFEEASPEHTGEVLSAVEAFLEDNPDIRHVVVATTTGETGLRFARALKDRHVVVVTHMTGFAEPNVNELRDDLREAIVAAGADILTTTHALAGVARGIRRQLGTWTATELLAVAFRTFGQGTKVCAEIAMMAADAGLVPVDTDVVCVGGTGRGADTAWVMRPANTSDFTGLKMRACICKPIDF